MHLFDAVPMWKLSVDELEKLCPYNDFNVFDLQELYQLILCDYSFSLSGSILSFLDYTHEEFFLLDVTNSDFICNVDFVNKPRMIIKFALRILNAD